MRGTRKAGSFFRTLNCTIIACCCFLLLSGAAFAQVDEGSITGTVTDASGAVVPDAQVTLLNTDQGITVQTTTGAGGSYTFSPVRAGHYRSRSRPRVLRKPRNPTLRSMSARL